MSGKERAEQCKSANRLLKAAHELHLYVLCIHEKGEIEVEKKKKEKTTTLMADAVVFFFDAMAVLLCSLWRRGKKGK